MRVKLLYFAWVKQKAGLAEEDVTLPGEIRDVSGVIDLPRLDKPYQQDQLAAEIASILTSNGGDAVRR